MRRRAQWERQRGWGVHRMGVVLALSAWAGPVAAQDTGLWQRTISGAVAGFDVAQAVAVDREGNVVVAGLTTNSGTRTDFSVAKLGPDGEVIWNRVVLGTEAGDGAARAVAVDRLGNVVVAGSTRNSGTNADFTVAKLGPDGAPIWQRSINGTENGADDAFSVAVDAQGNVVAAGLTRNTGTGGDFTVVKLNGGSGAPIWQRTVNGSASASDEAFSVAIDSQGNAVASGLTRNTGTDSDLTVMKLNRTNGATIWQRVINGTANGPDVGRSVAVDRQGNVAVAGFLGNSASGQDFAVLKLSGRNGAPIFQRTINGTANGADDAFSVAVDAEGNVSAGGFTMNSGTGIDFTVASFNRNGVPRWQHIIPGPAMFGELAFSVAVDAEGSVVAAGLLLFRQTQLDFAVAKFSKNGVPLWLRTVNGLANTGDEARAVAVDSQGNVVAVGFTQKSLDDADQTVVKLSRSGLPIWERVLNGGASGFDVAQAVAVDAQGNVVAAGRTANGATSQDFTVAKFARDGTLLWLRTVNGTVGNQDEALSVAVDAQGNVVAAGTTENTGTGLDLTVAKFSRDGAPIWERRINGSANSADQAVAVAVDRDGHVIAAGLITSTVTGRDLAVVKLDRATGAPIWQQPINGSANGADEASSVAVDRQGNVIAAGRLENTDAGSDFAVVKLARATGAPIWQRSINGSANDIDAAFSVAVDSQGNVVAAGAVTVGVPDRDFLVVKLNGGSGAPIWQRAINGSANGDDVAVKVAVDSQGNAVAAGFTTNSGTGPDLVVVKLNRINGTSIWERVINGTANATDQALSVAVDRQGNVVVAGQVQDSGEGQEFTVAKFNRDGAPLWQRALAGSGLGSGVAQSVAVDAQGNVFAAGFTDNVDTGADYTVARFDR